MKTTRLLAVEIKVRDEAHCSNECPFITWGENEQGLLAGIAPAKCRLFSQWLTLNHRRKLHPYIRVPDCKKKELA